MTRVRITALDLGGTVETPWRSELRSTDRVSFRLRVCVQSGADCVSCLKFSFWHLHPSPILVF